MLGSDGNPFKRSSVFTTLTDYHYPNEKIFIVVWCLAPKLHFWDQLLEVAHTQRSPLNLRHNLWKEKILSKTGFILKYLKYLYLSQWQRTFEWFLLSTLVRSLTIVYKISYYFFFVFRCFIDKA